MPGWPSRPLRRLIVGTAAALFVGGAIAGPAAATPWPSAPSGVHFLSASRSTFSVTMSRGTSVSRYVVWASTVRSNLYYDNLVTHDYRPSTLHYGISSSPAVTVRGLPYTTASYYYRIETRNWPHRRLSAAIYSTGLLPYTPKGLTVHNWSTGTYLTWAPVSATGYSVQQAADPAMRTDVHTFSIQGTTAQFTPFWLTQGTRAYWRIRPWNHNVAAAWTAVVSAAPVTREQGVRVMTYNVLGLGQDGTHLTGGTVAPWSQRRLSAAWLINTVKPSVIGVQEAYEWVGSTPGVRQVDSLCSALRAYGGAWVVARTEIPYPESGWHRYGNYILYDSATYAAVGAAGHFTVGGVSTVVYQELRNRSSGATFLFVTTHLLQAGGYSNDLAREAETKSMISTIGAIATRDHVPVVYTGDFNSNPQQTTVDGPGVAMGSALIADARLRAQYRVNDRYDSYNNYSRTPYPYSLFLDYVWVTPGVSASSWGLAMHTSGGRLVGTIPSDHNPVHAYVRFPY